MQDVVCIAFVHWSDEADEGTKNEKEKKWAHHPQTKKNIRIRTAIESRMPIGAKAETRKPETHGRDAAKQKRGPCMIFLALPESQFWTTHLFDAAIHIGFQLCLVGCCSARNSRIRWLREIVVVVYLNSAF